MEQFLDRKEYSKILALAECSQVKSLSSIIEKTYKVRVVRPAQKTLTMMQFREPVKSSLFYLGEVLCSECTVEINEVQGAAVIIGDDFAKATAAAVIDAAYNAGVPECAEINKQIITLGKNQLAARKALNAELKKSRVSFNTMGE